MGTSSLSTEKSICDGLSNLTILYKCMEDLLNLPLTQQALSHHHTEKWVNEFLDGSIRFLDICGLARDMVSQIKDQVRDLHCALRRRKGDSSTEESVAEYISLRKRIKKDAKRWVVDLKQLDHISNTHSHTVDLDHHVIAVVRVLVEVSEMTSSIFASIFLFFSSSLVSKPKPTRWSLVSKLILKGSEDQELGVPTNELESVDVALLNLCKIGSSNEGDKFQVAQKRLEEIEVEIESLDKGLGCIFRCLIRTRASVKYVVSIIQTQCISIHIIEDMLMDLKF